MVSSKTINLNAVITIYYTEEGAVDGLIVENVSDPLRGTLEMLLQSDEGLLALENHIGENNL